MNINTELLENNIQNLTSATDAKEANNLIIGIMKYLIETIDISDDVLKGYDKIEMRKLFGAFCQSTKAACDFFDSANDYLDPDAANGKIGTLINETQAKIRHTDEALQALERSESDLFRKEGKLTELKNKYDELEGKAAYLRSIEQTINKDTIKQLKISVSEKEKEIAETKKEYEKISNEQRKLQAELNDIINTLRSVSVSVNSIETNIFEVIDNHAETIKSIYEKNSVDIEQCKSEIDRYLYLYGKLAEDKEHYADLRAELNAHLGEDSCIVSALREYKIDSLDDYISRTTQLKNNIESELEELDNILKTAAAQEEKMHEQIAMLQNKR